MTEIHTEISKVSDTITSLEGKFSSFSTDVTSKVEARRIGRATKRTRGGRRRRSDDLPQGTPVSQRGETEDVTFGRFTQTRDAGPRGIEVGRRPTRRRIGRATKRTRGGRRRRSDDLPQGTPVSQRGETEDVT